MLCVFVCVCVYDLRLRNSSSAPLWILAVKTCDTAGGDEGFGVTKVESLGEEGVFDNSEDPQTWINILLNTNWYHW